MLIILKFNKRTNQELGETKLTKLAPKFYKFFKRDVHYRFITEQ